VRVIKWSTLWFTLILIAVGLATAFVKAHNPELSIIGIILGSFGYTYGSLLGIFMVALFTRSRGSELGNPIAMLAGFIAVAILSNLPNDIWKMLAGGNLYTNPEWLPLLTFPWRIMAGTLVTLTVALCFKSERAPSSEPF
jgi:Na+/proline symporter